MDPNTTLAELRALVRRLNELDQTTDTLSENEHNFLDLFPSLDHWLTNGGFPPDAWTTSPGVR
jgi:hypothetical protein